MVGGANPTAPHGPGFFVREATIPESIDAAGDTFSSRSPTIGPAGENLIFLLGLPRSGTTLLSMMIDNHPSLASPPEPWTMLALRELGRVDARHPANSQVLGSAFRHFAGEGGLIQAARAAGRALYSAHLAKSGKQYFVDKTPRYLLVPDYLATVFPKAHFLWLIRDPLDVAASYRTTWNVNLPEVLAETRDMPELFDLPLGLDRLETFHERHGAAVHVIRYEQLAANPVATLTAALSHLGLATDAPLVKQMCTLTNGRQGAGQFGDPKILATSAPHTNSLGTWRSVFTSAELNILLDAIGSERMRRLGYGDTVAALTDLGVRESAPQAWQGYRDQAEAVLAGRLANIDRVTRYQDGDDVLWWAQAPLQALLSGTRYEQQDRANHGDAAAEIARLQAALSEREVYIAGLLASTSWRLTAPLRAVVTTARRLFQ